MGTSESIGKRATIVEKLHGTVRGNSANESKAEMDSSALCGDFGFGFICFFISFIFNFFFFFYHGRGNGDWS